MSVTLLDKFGILQFYELRAPLIILLFSKFTEWNFWDIWSGNEQRDTINSIRKLNEKEVFQI